MTESHDQQNAPSRESAEPGRKEAPASAQGARARTDADVPPAAATAASAPQTLPDALARIAGLENDLEVARREVEEGRDRFLRDRAELENFKRRMQRERAEALRFANEPLLRDLVQVIDNLERAVRAARSAPAAEGVAAPDSTAVLVSGIEMVLSQFSETLARFGVARVSAAATAFDPAVHEALAQVESAEHAPGTVVEEHLPGYRLHDRLLRAAQVSVAKAPAPTEA